MAKLWIVFFLAIIALTQAQDVETTEDTANASTDPISEPLEIEQLSVSEQEVMLQKKSNDVKTPVS
jgi:hypothetical protein